MTESVECCKTLLCHVNHRFPMYCSDWALVNDQNATLKYNTGE